MTPEQYDKSVCLYYTNDSHRGPGVVVQNLIKGLRAIGVDVFNVHSRESAKYIGCLQAGFDTLIKQDQKNGKSVLLGPNLFVLPLENPQICKLSDNFVVPSQWVKDKYVQFDEMKNKNIHVWPVGIDTKKWAPIPPHPLWKKLDCVVYFKNRSEQDLRLVEALCRKYDLKYEVLRYGSYQEDDLYKLCQILHANKGFVVQLTGTESQGIAYMQMLSFDLPCYVFNNSTWKYDNGPFEFPATSVPYFDPKCGEVINNLHLDHFVQFVENVKQQKYSPREYIVQNHTLEKAAKHYFDLLRVCNGEKI